MGVIWFMFCKAVPCRQNLTWGRDNHDCDIDIFLQNALANKIFKAKPFYITRTENRGKKEENKCLKKSFIKTEDKILTTTNLFPYV